MTCAKQTVTATLTNNGQTWVATNHCANPQEVCPRADMESGVGYELCRLVCEQLGHAEVNVCLQAGKENTQGGKIRLEGHTYCCDNCKRVMAEYGIVEAEIII